MRGKGGDVKWKGAGEVYVIEIYGCLAASS